MQCLSGKHIEAILDELLVFGKGGSFQDLISSIGCIIKEGMADGLKMNPDLVGTAGFKTAFNQD